MEIREELKKADRLLEEKEPQLQILLRLSSQGVMVVDRQRCVTHFNPAMERLTGIPGRDAMGQPCRRLLKSCTIGGEWVCDTACSLNSSPGTRVAESPIRVDFACKQGRAAPMEMVVEPLTSRDGEVIGAVHIFTDISVRQEVERAKEDFLSLISHELRTPLTSISGYTQLLMRRVDGKPEHGDDMAALNAIKRQADRLADLIDTMLDVSRIEAGRLELRRLPIDLPRLISGAIAALEPSRRSAVRFAAPRIFPPVLADPRRVGQVLLNLLDNAAKYSPADGPVEIRLSTSGALAVVSVRDYGVGIDPTSMSNLFQRFQRAPGLASNLLPGTGLGLYISRLVVEAHGGTIWADSEPGMGSTFSFTLPLIVPTSGA